VPACVVPLVCPTATSVRKIATARGRSTAREYRSRLAGRP
jgi:hypothetical protein